MIALCIILAIALAFTIHVARFAALELFESQKQLEIARRRNATLHRDIAAHLAAADNLYGHVVKLEGRRHIILTRWWRHSHHRRLSAWQMPQRGSRT